MKKRVLITGVAGMIGSHLAEELLKKDYTVTGIDDLSFGSLDNLISCLGHINFQVLPGDYPGYRYT